MKPIRRSLQIALVLGAAVWLPSRAMADDRLAGYWVPGPMDAMTTPFSFSILGKWTIISAQWDGAGPILKVRYTVVTAGGGGTLTADQKLDQMPDAPRTITYEIKGGELFLTIPDTVHAGTYHLVKGVPPAATPPAPPAASPDGPAARPNPPRGPPPAKVRDPNAVLGSWTTEPGAPVQVGLSLVISGPANVKVTQLWIKGSDNPVTSRSADYAVTFGAGGGRGSLTKSKVDEEGPQVPVRMDYAFEGEALIVTVDDGAFAGQYRLVRKQK